MSAKRITVVLWIFVCSAGMAMGQTEWVDHPDNPIIGPGEPGAWDDGGRFSTAVLSDGTVYHMWFTGVDSAGDIGGFGHATSQDGVTWTMDPANPVLTRGAPGEWDDRFLTVSTAIYHENQFHMWYAAFHENRERTGYATSPDGSVWTKYVGNPVLDIGPTGSWYDWQIRPGQVIVEGDIYKMWFSGLQTPDGSVRVGYAISSDGIAWEMLPDPILEPGVYPGAWDAYRVVNPSVVSNDSIYHMWYAGSMIEGSQEIAKIGYAFSSDGVHWTKHADNPVVETTDEYAITAQVMFDGEEFTMWYSHGSEPFQSISLATSDRGPGVDGLTYAQYIPAAALASGAQGSFYQTDVDLNNAGSQAAEYQFTWLPRGENNSEPVTSESFTLGAGMSVRYANVLAEVFNLEPNSLGALAVMASSPDLLLMSRTYNLATVKSGGTFGQAIPAIKPGEFIERGERQRILFGSQSEDYRTNVGCINGTDTLGAVEIELFNAEGVSLKTERMRLDPWSNDQLNAIFSDYAPIEGYVDVWTMLPTGKFHCYGSVLDNVTSDPTTILPQ